jgi:CBS domain-containing membrane protein
MSQSDSLKVKDIMNPSVKSVRADELLDVADPFAEWWKIRHLPVVDASEKLVGLISHRDLLNHALLEILKPPSERKHFAHSSVKVDQFMLRKVISITEDASLEEAARLMYENKSGCLPVVNDKMQVVGMITEADFVRLYYEKK